MKIYGSVYKYLIYVNIYCIVEIKLSFFLNFTLYRAYTVPFVLSRIGIEPINRRTYRHLRHDDPGKYYV